MLSESGGGVIVVDISNPADPVIISRTVFGSGFSESSTLFARRSGGYPYVVDYVVYGFDWTVLSAPTIDLTLAVPPIDGSSGRQIYDLAFIPRDFLPQSVDGYYFNSVVFAAAGENGLVVFEFAY